MIPIHCSIFISQIFSCETQYSDPVDEQIRYELQVQYQILDEETIRLTVSEFRSKYDLNSVSRSNKFKDIKL